jgi:TfoX/Sxy family transcriptional regulator of competence genes
MAYDENLAKRIRGGLAWRRDITEKKMFGGIGFLLNGNMCVGVWKDSLIARLGSEQGTLALKKPHVREFDITGRAMSGWVMIDSEGLREDEQLFQWIERSVTFVQTLPAK